MADLREVIHPFENGHGRLGRALADMALAQDMHAHDPQASAALVRVNGCMAWLTRYSKPAPPTATR